MGKTDEKQDTSDGNTFGVRYERGTDIRVAEMAILSRSWMACLPEKVAFVPSSEERGTGSEECLEVSQVEGTAGTKTLS